MYLHLGHETLVITRDIVGLFDLDTTTLSKNTRDTLALAEKQGRVVNVSYELPKSFVATSDNTIYVSQLGTDTLRKRYESQVKAKKILDKLF